MNYENCPCCNKMIKIVVCSCQIDLSGNYVTTNTCIKKNFEI